jgi:triosephosphate isomerase
MIVGCASSCSPLQLANAGIPYVILGSLLCSVFGDNFAFSCKKTLGHSERRSKFHETSALVAIKVRAALNEGLSVIVCVGETESERIEGKTQQVVNEQLAVVVKEVGKAESDWA